MARKKKQVLTPEQLVAFAPESDWRPPDVNSLPSWEGLKRVGIDTETRDPTLKKKGIGVRHGGYVTGVSFAFEDGPSFYLPIRHDAGGNLDTDHVFQYLKDQARVFTGDIVGAHLQYDLDYLAQEAVVFRRAKFFRDVQVADPLINELHFRYSLQAISERHGFEGKDETLLREAADVFGVDPKADMWKLHSKYVGAYAEEDATLPLRILRRQERIIDEEDLWEIYDLESRLLPVLVKMRRRGVLIDQDRMAEAEEWLLGEEERLLNEVHRLVGHQVGVGNVWKPDIMAAPLESIGIKLALDGRGKPKVNADGLDGIEHPIGKLLLRARRINKARTTFIESIKTHMSDGRIHATFNQLKREKDGGTGSEATEGAAYGRLSCTHPNLQQQPSPDKDPEIGTMIRALYLPDEGGVWAANDYSQQEPRWLTHFAEVCGLRGAREAGDRYRDNPDTDNHQMMAEMCSIERKPAKTIYLGLCYGMGGPKLSVKLGLPTRWLVRVGYRETYYFDHDKHEEAMTRARSRDGRIIKVAGEEAQVLLDKFNDAAPYVRSLMKLAEKQAKRNGYVKTIHGRRCRFPVDANGNFDWTYKGGNRLIQGSAGDQTKKAMVDCDEAGFYLQIQVHDELGQTVADMAQALAIAEVMENCTPCRVPSRVDIELGPNWGEAK